MDNRAVVIDDLPLELLPFAGELVRARDVMMTVIRPALSPRGLTLDDFVVLITTEEAARAANLDTISIHPLERVLRKIEDAGCRADIAAKPETDHVRVVIAPGPDSRRIILSIPVPRLDPFDSDSVS